MVEKHMPSPLGHALAGMAAAWAVDVLPGRRVFRTTSPTAPSVARTSGALTLVAAALGVAPDLDLFLAQHRAITHSVGAVMIVFIVAIVVTGWVRGKVQRSKFKVQSVGRVAAICAAAYASHLLLDWLAVDRRLPFGLQLWWPFSDGWYVSGLDVFPQTERRNLLSLATLRINLRAMSFEAAVMLPILGLVWLASRVRVKTLTGLPAEAAPRDHAP
jgi:membrane-bound metal-dependent hydrolase YbcI (DUF457 family)